ncbi:MAG: hypothetical protein NXI24_12870 [bacterium]|nr:hypothetical protein [bacterium]
MLREINAAAQNNTASNQMSQSALTVRNMPAPTQLLTESNIARQADTDLRTVGADTASSPLDNFQINLLA